jgi:hypothetical protein
MFTIHDSDGLVRFCADQCPISSRVSSADINPTILVVMLAARSLADPVLGS